MSAAASNNPCRCSRQRYGVREGVTIEILWDIEKEIKEGRREGHRVVNSVWWRAEVIELKDDRGRLKARIRYEANDDFESQCGNVWLFPFVVKLVKDKNTQLPWRFYVCSGNDDDETEGKYWDVDVKDNSDAEYGVACKHGMLQESLATLLQRHEWLERYVMAQAKQQLLFLGSGSSGDRSCGRLYDALRQKTAVMLQRGIPSAKSRKGSDGTETFFEDCCSGVLTTEIDCGLKEFEVFARVMRSRSDVSYFRPSFAETQNPSPSLELIEICFPSLSSICDVMGIAAHSDLMYMARRDKKVTADKDKHSSEPAVRLLGTSMFDPDDEQSATAFMICQGLDKSRLDTKFHAVIRSSREFDFSSMKYEHPLLLNTETGIQLVQRVYKQRLQNKSEAEQLRFAEEVMEGSKTFTIRWRSLPTPNPRIWTRPVAISEEVLGMLEVEFPYVIFRGKQAVDEILRIVDVSFLKQRLSTVLSE